MSCPLLTEISWHCVQLTQILQRRKKPWGVICEEKMLRSDGCPPKWVGDVSFIPDLFGRPPADKETFFHCWCKSKKYFLNLKYNYLLYTAKLHIDAALRGVQTIKTLARKYQEILIVPLWKIWIPLEMRKKVLWQSGTRCQAYITKYYNVPDAHSITVSARLGQFVSKIWKWKNTVCSKLKFPKKWKGIFFFIFLAQLACEFAWFCKYLQAFCIQHF